MRRGKAQSTQAIATKPAEVISIDSGGHRERIRAERDALIEAHTEMVLTIARQLYGCLPASFALDDLIGVGNLALARAALRYRPADHGGAPFSAYARFVVRGAMLDSVRGRNYTASTHVSIDEEFPTALAELSKDPAIDELLDSARLRRRVSAAIELLPDRQRQVLTAYYGSDEPSLAVVGSRLGISATRATQLHASAVDRLRHLLRAVV